MADEYFRSFADGIADFTEVAVTSGHTAPVWTVVSTNQVQATSASSHNEALTWNVIDLDGDRADVELYGEIYLDSTSTTQRWYCVRLSGGTGYALRVRTTSIDIYRFTGSTFTSIAGTTISISSGTWPHIRFRVNSNVLRARIWTGVPADEGTSWTVDTTDSTYTAAGSVGLLKAANTNTQLWRNLGVATGGGTAPTAAISSGYTLTCAAGSYALTGQAASLVRTRRLVAEQGAYTITGQAAGLQRTRRLAAEQGTYTLTGQVAGLQLARRLAAEQGAYTLTGVAAILARSRVLAADQGAYTLSGQAAGLTYTPAGSYTLSCDAGSYSLNGQAVSLRAARRVVAEPGSYALMGQAAGLSKVSGYTLAADAGSYSVTGQAAGLARSRVLQCAAGAYTLTGQPVTFTYSGVQAPVLSVAPLGRVRAGTGRPAAVSTTRRPAQLSTRTR